LNYLAADYSEYLNNQYAKFYGLELITTTRKIESLNSSFYIGASLGYSEGGLMGDEWIYGTPSQWSSLDSVKKIYHVGNIIIPAYSPDKTLSGWNQKLMLTYKWDYTIRKLGLWFTLWAQQIVYVRNKYVENNNKTALGYYSDIDGGKYIPYTSDVPDEAKFKTFYESELSTPIVDTWTFNINISKSLYRGAEVSFFVNNFLDRTNNIFYGLEFSMDINKIFE